MLWKSSVPSHLSWIQTYTFLSGNYIIWETIIKMRRHKNSQSSHKAGNSLFLQASIVRLHKTCYQIKFTGCFFIVWFNDIKGQEWSLQSRLQLTVTQVLNTRAISRINKSSNTQPRSSSALDLISYFETCKEAEIITIIHNQEINQAIETDTNDWVNSIGR